MINVKTQKVGNGSIIEVQVAGKPSDCMIEMGTVVKEFCEKIAITNNNSPFEILCEILSLATVDLIEKEKNK